MSTSYIVRLEIEHNASCRGSRFLWHNVNVSLNPKWIFLITNMLLIIAFLMLYLPSQSESKQVSPS